MHTIEKEVLVEALYRKIFNSYCHGVMGGYIVKHGIRLPLLRLECTGKGAAGYYRPPFVTRMRAEIMVNLAYYNGGATANLETTIAHELAHHIAHCIWPHCKQWHGPEFRMVMQSIGYSGDTYHNMSVSVARKVAQKSKDELFDL